MPLGDEFRESGGFSTCLVLGMECLGAAGAVLVVFGAALAMGAELSVEWRGWDEEWGYGGKDGERRGNRRVGPTK